VKQPIQTTPPHFITSGLLSEWQGVKDDMKTFGGLDSSDNPAILGITNDITSEL